MRELGQELGAILYSLSKDAANGSRLAFRLVVPIVANAAKQRLTWYGLVMAAMLYLSFAPIVKKWDDKATAKSFVALAALYPVGELLAKGLDRDITKLAIQRHIRWLAEVDETVHEFNVIRAINNNEIRQIDGEYTMGELQIRLSESQEKMMQAMGDLQAVTTGGAGELPAAAPALEGIEELDLVQESAENDKSLLLSAPSGVGKTTIVKHLIHAIEVTYEGEATRTIIDFKGTTGHYCGLEKTSDYIKSGASGSNFDEAAIAIAATVGLLDSKATKQPYYLFADEINNGLEQSRDAKLPEIEGLPKSNRKPEEQFKTWLKFIVTQGRERNIRGVFTAHGNLMTLLGIDGDTAQSLVGAVLGRKLPKGDGFNLIYKAIQNDIFISKADRPRLIERFSKAKAIAEQDGRMIALTNIRGEWDVYFVPSRYAADPGRLKQPALSQGEQFDERLTQIVEEVIQEESDRSRLEELLNQEAKAPHEDFYHSNQSANQIPFEKLSEHLQLIIETSEVFGWITARKLMREQPRLRQFSADEIRAFFNKLVELGWGVTQGEGKSLCWLLDPKYDRGEGA